MAFAQLIEACERVVEATAAGGRSNTEERIGHSAHGGDDNGGPASVAGARSANNLNQPLNCFGIGDGGTAEFLDNHKQKILYGKAGVTAPSGARSLIAIVVVLRDQAIVAARPRNDLVISPREFVGFRALTIEGRDSLFMIVR
jgi:hypothetical protein